MFSFLGIMLLSDSVDWQMRSIVMIERMVSFKLTRDLISLGVTCLTRKESLSKLFFLFPHLNVEPYILLVQYFIFLLY